MTARDVPVRIEELLSHHVWVRRLALVLTRDVDDADDVVQQTYLTALRSPPRHAASPRGWLATVLRNAVRARTRADGRRGRREAVVARPLTAHVDDDPAETTARAELHAAVTAAVVALDEPYRRAILLRHFEELPVAEVARRTDVPLETARARLRRGRAMLRERLVHDVGDGRPLAVALLPLTRGNMGPGGAAGVVGGALVTGKIVSAAVVAALLVSAAWWWSDGSSGGGAVDGPVEQATALPAAPEEPVEVRSGEPRERVHVAPDRTAEHAVIAEEDVEPIATEAPEDVELTPTDDGPPMAQRLECPVTFDLHAATLGDVLGRIAWQADLPLYVDLDSVSALETKTSMNIQGGAARDALRFATMIAALEMRVESERVVLHAKGLQWEDERAVLRIEPFPEPEAPEPVHVSGRVVSPDGAAVVGATVIGLPRAMLTDSDGTFVVDVPPRTYRVRASAPGFVPTAWTPLVVEEGAGEQELVVEFDRVATTIVVNVTTTGQQALPEALVRALRRGTQEEAAVTFTDGVALLRETAEGRVTLRVTAKGHAPVEKSVIGVAGETLNVEMTLEPRTLSERLRTERTTLEYDRRPLSQVVGDLTSRWDVTVRLDSYVPHETSAKAVSLRVSDDTLEGALRALGQATSTTYRVDDESEIVWISAER